jgi:phospholipase D1/2
VHESIHSDPYACVILKGATVARTRVISNASNPQWHEHFEIPVAHTVSEVVFVVKDNDIMGAQFIGQVLIPAEKIVSEKAIERRSFSLVGKDNKPLKPDATLEISIKYTSVAEDPSYRNGICAGPNHKGVQKTYFPMRKGGRVTLYQDAHVPDGCLPTFELQNGMKFEQGKCWEDIYQAIVDARHLVYVAGWSIYTSTKLIRDGIQGKIPSSDRTLGELLKHKAEQETARVLLLVWDDKTSHSVIGNVCFDHMFSLTISNGF